MWCSTPAIAALQERTTEMQGSLAHLSTHNSTRQGQWKTLPLRRLWRGWREAQSFRALTALTGLVPGSWMTAHNFRIWPARVWWARLWQALSFSPIPSALPKIVKIPFLKLAINVCTLIRPLPPPKADYKIQLSKYWKSLTIKSTLWFTKLKFDTSP